MNDISAAKEGNMCAAIWEFHYRAVIGGLECYAADFEYIPRKTTGREAVIYLMKLTPNYC